MYKIDPETLDIQRLRRVVDRSTYTTGEALFNAHVVQLDNRTDTTATFTVTDKRNYHVELTIKNEHIFLKCSCLHASRGLVCEHAVASWLTLYQDIQTNRPPLWQGQLNTVLSLAPSSTNKAGKSSPYLLFFALYINDTGYNTAVKIIPYVISASHLSAEMRAAVIQRPEDANALLINETALQAKLRSPRRLNPKDCLNCSPELVNLANLIIEHSQSHVGYYRYASYSGYSSAALADYLYLLRAHQAAIFFNEDHSQPRLIHILPGLVELRIDLNNDGPNLSLEGILTSPGQPDMKISALKRDDDDDELISLTSDGSWLLFNDLIFQVNNEEFFTLLDRFMKTPNFIIPEDAKENFLDQYLLSLAQRFELGGDALAWDDVNQPPTPRLYLSENNGSLEAQLRFGYGDAEVTSSAAFPPSSVQRRPDSATLLRIYRQPEVEEEAAKKIGSAAFGLKRTSIFGVFQLRARTHPVDFLLNYLPKLAAQGFEIYGEEQLKLARVNRNTPTISFHVASGIDWFDVHAVVRFGDVDVGFNDLRRVMRKRERFIKLADGSIGEIPSDWLDRYKQLFDLSESGEDSLHVSRHHITLLEEALGEADRAETDAEYQRRRERLRALTSENFAGIPKLTLPEGFTGDLRPYQKAGFEWLHFLHDFEFGGCLADDMGLGKTVQALVFLESLYADPAKRPPAASLLVVPRSLLINWQREAERFTPNLRILEFFDSARSKDTAVFNDVDLVITTYGVMLRDIEFLHGYTFYYAILDESQAIKNPASQTARSAHLLRAHNRLALTGTPIENSTSELWSQFAFLNPGLLGTMQYFKNEFGAPIEKKQDESAAMRLRRMVFPFILRRTKDQVAPELPPRTERMLTCDMSVPQRKLYNKTRDYYRGVLLGMVEDNGLDNSRMKILEGLLRLRQICNHPLLVDEKYRADSAKFELLLDTLETLQSEGHKALVFSQFVKMLSLVRAELDARDVPYAYLDGQTTNRQERVDAFQNDPTIPFFLISLKAGGLGLNLTAADYVIHIDPWWNPAVEMQASDRTHRIGQDKPVFVYKLIAKDSVEEKILLLQDRKRALVDQIITTEGSFFKNITVEDVQALFS